MNRGTARIVFTLLMYGGVLIFLLPYVLERSRFAPFLMLSGAIIAVVCGLLRCYFTENDE
ncbi:MAG: hypothetical protein PW789_03315 [Edaphobacter sp.]|uniref:hypothetical protein n=1 Tax=Edaphobacter sp. TaxID=1934404 RepID=UPI002398066B|nr:hypothetical protein [Edaphobacter sp.]MDE1175614.1 hypothetical protein [Edaphobacter sp.]